MIAVSNTADKNHNLKRKTNINIMDDVCHFIGNTPGLLSVYEVNSIVMNRNLETADLIVKLALAIMLLIFYFTGLISGSFALILAILSFGVVALFVAKFLWSRMMND